MGALSVGSQARAEDGCSLDDEIVPRMDTRLCVQPFHLSVGKSKFHWPSWELRVPSALHGILAPKAVVPDFR